jgi:hypothetical protein
MEATAMSKLLSPGEKARRTAKWARTMTKWLVTYSRRRGARWNVIDFGGQTNAEARGVVDLIAIRKNHRDARQNLKRGDLFDIVLIQTKGGSAARPTADDVARLVSVAKYHHAKAVVLAVWRRGVQLEFFKLHRAAWVAVPAGQIFG